MHAQVSVVVVIGVQDLFHSVYFEYEENCTHDRLLSLNYAFCNIKRLLKTSEPVYRD